MTIGERIKQVRMQKGLTQKQVAERCGMADSAIRKYESGIIRPKIETLHRLSDALGVHILELMEVDKELSRYSYELTDVQQLPGSPPLSAAQKREFISEISKMSLYDMYDSLSDEEKLQFWRLQSEGADINHDKKDVAQYSAEALQLARDYDQKLDAWGRKAVRELADNEIARCEDETRFLEETAPPEEPKVIPLYWVPAAAGLASPIFGSDFDYYTLKPEDPHGAVFAIKVQGDSMEPYFPDGSIAFCNKDPLADGDIGIFCLDGDSFIKQYHYDQFMGMTYLFSLNRDRSDADKLITRTGGQTLTCFGRVITKRRFSLPM